MSKLTVQIDEQAPRLGGLDVYAVVEDGDRWIARFYGSLAKERAKTYVEREALLIGLREAYDEVQGFRDPDSVLDQQTDAELRSRAEVAQNRLDAFLAKLPKAEG